MTPLGVNDFLFDTADRKERFILVAVDKAGDPETEASLSLDELDELVKTAGGESVGRVCQKREKPHPSLYVGKGKLEEIKELAKRENADGIVCDDELSNARRRAMSEFLNVKIMDRTLVILDIFAKRAETAEGKAQVELAQLKYNYSRLEGGGAAMSRLGGGIGTRGPGEKKLETDRRLMKERILDLDAELADMAARRGVMRKQREKSGIPVISLVGYTNAGKSTLMNALSGAGVAAEDKLFATLGATTREIKTKNGCLALLTDTVGFIRKLPHSLIKAFHATLEEVTLSDALVHVVDAQSQDMDRRMEVVYDTLEGLSCLSKPIITVFNKCDGLVEKPFSQDALARSTVCASALTGEGMDDLSDAIELILRETRTRAMFFIPFSDGNAVAAVYKSCDIISEESDENGWSFDVYCDAAAKGALKKYMRYAR